jgi:hypothetical protein
MITAGGDRAEFQSPGSDQHWNISRGARPVAELAELIAAPTVSSSVGLERARVPVTCADARK